MVCSPSGQLEQHLHILGPPEKLAEDLLALGFPTHIQDKIFNPLWGRQQFSVAKNASV